LNGTATGVMRHLQTLSPHEVTVCSVVKAELFYGAMKSTNPTKTLAKQQEFLSQFHSYPFDDHAAEEYGSIRAFLARQGTPIGPNDLMIAAIALARSVTLVTHNIREFSRVPGLSLADWIANG
jgi:tRNA(fMet)-specific endonuclease VapC